MASLPINDAEIRAHTAGGSYDRGREYLEDGAVQSLTLDDEHTLQAKVQGSAVHPYVVQVQFDDEDITTVECTCPYHGGTWCKHIVAVLLKALETDAVPKSEPATVAEMVESLDREDLVELLKHLAERKPELVDLIEEERGHLSAESSV